MAIDDVTTSASIARAGSGDISTSSIAGIAPTVTKTASEQTASNSSVTVRFKTCGPELNDSTANRRSPSVVGVLTPKGPSRSLSHSALSVFTV